jgi:DNA-binding XRE family transcriptional regulator
MLEDTRKAKLERKIRMKPRRGIHSAGSAAADLNAIVGQNIYEIRKALDLTQERMAERTGLSLSSLGSLERGQNNITLTSLGDLAAAYGVDPHALLCGKDYEVGAGTGLSLETLARLTSAIDGRVQAMLVKYGPIAIGQTHLASVLGALFDAFSDTEKFQTTRQQSGK